VREKERERDRQTEAHLDEEVNRVAIVVERGVGSHDELGLSIRFDRSTEGEWQENSRKERLINTHQGMDNECGNS